MNFFAFDLRKALIVLVVIALPLLSINMKRNPGEDPWYTQPFNAGVSLIQSGYSSFTSGVRGTTSMYLKMVGIKKENVTLQKENEELRAQLGALAELKLENVRLTELLDFKRSTSMELLAAKVIARDLSPDHSSIRINRGTRHGLKKLQGVITVQGVVGYVLRADSDSSVILVLTDRSAAIDAIVQRTRARGLVSGKNISTCRLRYLERADDVAAGDMIVTSGLQGYFPKGFPIGKLTSVRKTDFGISQEAELEPVVNPANLEEVFVVLNSGQEDFSEKTQTDGETPLAGSVAAPGTTTVVAANAASATTPNAATQPAQKPAQKPSPAPSAPSLATPAPKPSPAVVPAAGTGTTTAPAATPISGGTP